MEGASRLGEHDDCITGLLDPSRMQTAGDYWVHADASRGSMRARIFHTPLPRGKLAAGLTLRAKCSSVGEPGRTRFLFPAAARKVAAGQTAPLHPLDRRTSSPWSRSSSRGNNPCSGGKRSRVLAGLTAPCRLQPSREHGRSTS